jgi:hypothetical protein
MINLSPLKMDEIVIILNLKRKVMGTFVFLLGRVGSGGEAMGTRKILFPKKKNY